MPNEKDRKKPAQADEPDARTAGEHADDARTADERTTDAQTENEKLKELRRYPTDSVRGAGPNPQTEEEKEEARKRFPDHAQAPNRGPEQPKQ
jgi:hypothetical protein